MRGTIAPGSRYRLRVSSITSRLRRDTNIPGHRTVQVKTWTDFQQLIAADDFKGWAFRGQEDASWRLESTVGRVLRNFKVHPSVWRDQEQRVFNISAARPICSWTIRRLTMTTFSGWR